METHHIIARSAFGKKMKVEQNNPMNMITIPKLTHDEHTQGIVNHTMWFCDSQYMKYGQPFVDYMIRNRHRNKKVSEWLTVKGL